MRKLLLLLPSIAVTTFIILYIVATFYYPGGSQFDDKATGFSWLHNYWCNLLNETAINGTPNKAQPIALAAMFVLCAALISFWLQFPKYTALHNNYRLMIKISGTLAAITGLLLFTTLNHDLVTNLSSLFGVIATAGTLAGIYKNNWKILFAIGLGCLLLVGLNNFFYYQSAYIVYLPIVQKITFAVFLVWLVMINLKMLRS